MSPSMQLAQKIPHVISVHLHDCIVWCWTATKFFVGRLKQLAESIASFVCQFGRFAHLWMIFFDMAGSERFFEETISISFENPSVLPGLSFEKRNSTRRHIPKLIGIGSLEPFIKLIGFESE